MAAEALCGREARLRSIFGAILLARLLYPFFNSPFDHLFSDPLRHWQTGVDFLHPDVMGGGDPFFYQFWLFLVQSVARGSQPVVLIACGILCAGMPYGWYRALRELRCRETAFAGSIIMGVVPGFIGVYGYFMTESLLLTLTAFAFWLTLRAARKGTVGAFAAAAAVWIAASHTRIVALPMAALCLGCLWATLPRKLRNAAVAIVLATALTLAAGFHGRAGLGYFVPLGNLYMNAIYHDSGRKEIGVDFGTHGRYGFGCPSYYNPTFYPFSGWTTSRVGTVAIAIDPQHGRADWVREAQRVRAESHLSTLQDRWENLVFLAFGQEWPDNDRQTFIGWLTVWSRWVWCPIAAAVAVCAARRRYRGFEWLLPVCGLSLTVLLAMQSEGLMEGRFRKPVEPVLLASLWLALATPRRREAVS